MTVEYTIDIASPPDHVWKVFSDIERWPEWTASMNNVQRLESTPFGDGSQARISQPRLPTMIWKVTRFEPGHGFVWETRAWGAHTVAEHWIEPNGNGGSTVVLKVVQNGPLVPIFAPLMSRMTRRYVEMEARGLKRRSESRAA